MELLDPTTSQPLPPDAIQRVLFISSSTHIYNIPPLPSTAGHSASAWTSDPARHIFTARLRLIETSSSSIATPNNLKADIVLEDPATGQLFAAAPYTSPAIVEPVVDSSRFFAIVVRDPQGRKAMLGVGFEERSDAFDFGVALQEARKALNLEAPKGSAASQAAAGQEKKPVVEDKDYSLKEGETITVNLSGTRVWRRKPQGGGGEHFNDEGSADLQSFALAPPPSAGGGGFALPPPPSATDVKTKRRSIRDMGFDDGQFGEFA